MYKDTAGGVFDADDLVNLVYLYFKINHGEGEGQTVSRVPFVASINAENTVVTIDFGDIDLSDTSYSLSLNSDPIGAALQENGITVGVSDHSDVFAPPNALNYHDADGNRGVPAKKTFALDICSTFPVTPPPHVPKASVRVKPYLPYTSHTLLPEHFVATYVLPGIGLSLRDFRRLFDPDKSVYEYEHKLSTKSDCSDNVQYKGFRAPKSGAGDDVISGWNDYFYSFSGGPERLQQISYPDGLYGSSIYYTTSVTPDNYTNYYACLRRRLVGCTEWSNPVSAAPTTIARCSPAGRLSHASADPPQRPSKPCEFGVYGNDYVVNKYSHQWTCSGYELDDSNPAHKKDPYTLQCKQCRGNAGRGDSYMEITEYGVVCADCEQEGELCEGDSVKYTYRCIGEDGKQFGYTSPFVSEDCAYGCENGRCNPDPSVVPDDDPRRNCEVKRGECRDGNVWHYQFIEEEGACGWALQRDCGGQGCHDIPSIWKWPICSPCNSRRCIDGVTLESGSCETGTCGENTNHPGDTYHKGGCRTSCDVPESQKSCGAGGRSWEQVCMR